MLRYLEIRSEETMSRRILLADDSVTIQKVIELTFMDDDYEVRAVGNGDEALAMLTALQVDFVIADVHMPGASGYEVCRRSKQERPEVPVLLLVGTFEPFDEAQARAAGADSFLKKPFDSQELLSRVHELLGGTKAASAAPPAEAAPSPVAQGSFQGLAAAAPPAASPFAVPKTAAPAAASPPGHEGLATPAAASASGHEGHAAPAAASAPDHDGDAAPRPEVIATGEHGIEAAATWQEFELEAEPELIPDPWEDHRGAPAAAPPAASAPSHFEQPFALGDLDEPEPLQAPGMPATAGFEPPAASPPPVHAVSPTPPTVRPHDLSPAGGDGEHLPFTLGEPLDERPFSLGGSDLAAPGARHGERPTVAEPVFSFAPAAPPASPGSGGRDAAAERDAATEKDATTAPAAAAEDNGKLSPGGVGSPQGALSEAEVDRIARRVVELIGEKVVRDVAWEVIPDLAEVVIKDRLRELESQVE
jgi:CheY-like chemotaxis protein